MHFQQLKKQFGKKEHLLCMLSLSALSAKSDEQRTSSKHKPISAAYYFCKHSRLIRKTWPYVGKDGVGKLIIELNKLAQ